MSAIKTCIEVINMMIHVLFDAKQTKDVEKSSNTDTHLPLHQGYLLD